MQTQKITEKGITKELVFFLGINVIKHILANKTETEEGRLRLIEGAIRLINELLEHVDHLIDTEVIGVTDEKKI